VKHELHVFDGGCVARHVGFSLGRMSEYLLVLLFILPLCAGC